MLVYPAQNKEGSPFAIERGGEMPKGEDDVSLSKCSERGSSKFIVEDSSTISLASPPAPSKHKELHEESIKTGVATGREVWRVVEVHSNTPLVSFIS